MKISVSSRRELKNQGSEGSEMMPMDFWIDFGIILDVFWDEKSSRFFDRFLDVLFLRLGNATLLQGDFNATLTGALTAQMPPRRRP